MEIVENDNSYPDVTEELRKVIMESERLAFQKSMESTSSCSFDELYNPIGGCVRGEDPTDFAPSHDFKVLDSGKREEFSTGARRDVQEDKPRYDLLPVESLKRLSELYQKGALKYSEDNWKKGIPYTRVIASLLRHVYAFIEGNATEDHLSAVAWNAFTLIYYQERIKLGKLPRDLDDREI